MNLKTTIALILLAGAGAGGWTWLVMRQPTAEKESPTLAFLQNNLTRDAVTRVELTRMDRPVDEAARFASVVGFLATSNPSPLNLVGDLTPPLKRTLVVLEKRGGEWTLPGNWPVRSLEVKQYLDALTSLTSRFAPIPLDAKRDLTPYGIDDYALTIRVTTGDETHTLRLGEKPGAGLSFTRPNYLFLSKKDEVIQLGPGVFEMLNRDQDYFQQRRLFPVERVAKDEDSKEKVEQVAATSIGVQTRDAKFTLEKRNGSWILKNPSKKVFDPKTKASEWKRICSEDRVDPARRDALLRAFPDLWAEKFVDGVKTPEETGLNDPDFVLSATGASGPIKLSIGKISHSSRKVVLKQMGQQLMPMDVVEEYRYAKVDQNNQLFEIKSEKLRDLGVDVDELRDPKLARFKTDDARRLEINHAGRELVFVKVKEKDDDKKSKEIWRLEKPTKENVESAVVDELFEKIASLQARDKEIIDNADLKTLGLVKPTTQIKITLAEADKDSANANAKDAKKKARVVVFSLGRKDKDADKVYVRVDGWPRVNQVGDDVWKLATRSELAYRPRELWKLDADTITKIGIQGGKAAYFLQRGDKAWKIGGPLEADATGTTVDALADELARLKAEKFEEKSPKDLAKYGLDKPAFKITVTVKDGKPRELEIGKRIESKEGGRFARIAGGDAVFVVSEKLASNLRADAFELVDAGGLSLNPALLSRIRYQAPASAFTLESQKGRWQVTGSPAGAFPAGDEPLKTALAPWGKLRADRVAAIGPKLDYASFGLAPPSLTITVTADPDAKDKSKKPTEHVIELGKQADGSGARFARIDKKNTVVVFDALTSGQLARTHLDFLDHRVLRFDAEAVKTITRKLGGADLELIRPDDVWQMIKPGIRDADNLTVFDLLRSASLLRVARIAEYPAKDLKAFGLDKPFAVVTFQLELGIEVKRHVIKLGDPVKDADKKETGERYAIIDDQKMVVVLPAELSKHLAAAPLYFADRNLANFGAVDRAEFTRGARKGTFVLTPSGWEMTEPEPAGANGKALDDLIRAMQRLRADEIVADKAVDLKKFGLMQPAAQWRFKSGGSEKLNLILGAPESATPGARRYAKLGDKNAIFVLNGKLAAALLAEYRNRSPMPKFELDKPVKLTVTGGKDKPFTLEKKDGKWLLAGDPKASVKVAEVFDTLASLASLQVLHYVADAKADLKQFGLATPAWKIEVQLTVGKREIWLGNTEDKSKRYFATIPGTGAVFVLDEIDSATFTRVRSAYLEADKKK